MLTVWQKFVALTLLIVTSFFLLTVGYTFTSILIEVVSLTIKGM